MTNIRDSDQYWSFYDKLQEIGYVLLSFGAYAILGAIIGLFINHAIWIFTDHNAPLSYVLALGTFVGGGWYLAWEAP